jgi:hypothetical protein
MSLMSAGSIQCVELDWYAVGDGDVVGVTPRNQTRFEIQMDRAIQILQLANEAERFNKQFKLLLQKIAAWIKPRSAKIEAAYMTLQDGTLAFIIVRHESRYDEVLQDDLADLDVEIANDGDLDLINLATLALPNVDEAATLSFLDKRLVLTYSKDGERAKPHQLGEQQS